jgi:hypothetical protein
MGADDLLSFSNLIWLAFSLQLLGYAARDELKLRLLMLSGGLIYVLHFVLLSGGPLWSSVITNVALVAINAVVTTIVIFERTMVGITGERADIYRRFSMLRPGQFRKLIGAGTVQTAESEAPVIREGEQVKTLFFVLEGNAVVTKGGMTTSIGPDVFLGEVAYLTGVRASATVHLTPGSRFVAWPHQKLERMIARSPEMKMALVALLNQDMAGKVASSMPTELRRGA